MCACPGWYVVASVFAGVSVLFSRRRKWSWIVLFFCLLMMVGQFFALIHENKRDTERLRRNKAHLEQKQSQSNDSVTKTNIH